MYASSRYVNIISIGQKLICTIQFQNPDDLNNKFLLTTNNEEETVFHNVPFNGNVQDVEGIWKWHKKNCQHSS
jgi:hypothetical protein